MHGGAVSLQQPGRATLAGAVPGRKEGAGPALDIGARRSTLSAPSVDGAVAQLGERDVRNVEVRGSIPLGSTTYPPQGVPKVHRL